MAQRRIRDAKKSITNNTLYCVIDGVYTPVVYQQVAEDEELYYNEVKVMPRNKIARRESLKGGHQPVVIKESVTTTTTKPQGTTTTTTVSSVSPLAIFDYRSNIQHSSELIGSWDSTLTSVYLEQTTSANKPRLGRRKGGSANNVAPFFVKGTANDTGSYMSFNSALTISGDFTIMAYFRPNNIKYVRMLGNSSDSNIFLSFNEDSSLNLHFGLGSGKTHAISLGTSAIGFDKNYQVTIQRSGTTLYARVNGTQAATATVTTDDFVINQLGRVGTSINTFGGHIMHLSIYDGYITSRLPYLEKAITKTSSKAQLD